LSTAGGAYAGEDDLVDDDKGDASIKGITRIGDDGSAGEGASKNAKSRAKKKMHGVVGTFRALQASMIAGLLKGVTKGKDATAEGIKVCVNLAVMVPDMLPRISVMVSLSTGMLEGLTGGVNMLVHRALKAITAKMEKITAPFDVPIKDNESKLIGLVGDAVRGARANNHVPFQLAMKPFTLNLYNHDRFRLN